MGVGGGASVRDGGRRGKRNGLGVNNSSTEGQRMQAEMEGEEAGRRFCCGGCRGSGRGRCHQTDPRGQNPSLGVNSWVEGEGRRGRTDGQMAAEERRNFFF